MPSSRTLALRLAAGSLLVGPAVATAAPSGDAGEGAAASDAAPGEETEPEASPGEAKAEPAPGGDAVAEEAGPAAGGEAGEAAGAATGVAAGLEGLRGRAKAAGRGAKEKARSARREAAAATGDDGSLSKRKDRPWVQRWTPERNMLELGAFGGVLVPARDLELFEPRPARPRQGFLPLKSVAPDVGVRVGYFPLRFLGLEAEGAIMPTSTLEDGYYARLWSLRGHVVAQLPFSSIAPFVVVGAGALGIDSHRLVLGDDVDPAIHLGIGTKIYLDRRFALRLDLRDEISPRRGTSGGATNSIEALLGVSLTLGRVRDRDETPRPEPDPPPPPRDLDADDDGFLDAEDACPSEAGVAPKGCPALADPDGDGFPREDACPDEAGVAPDGCPDRDADRDGILMPDDVCPESAEEFNGFEDGDGCPDEVPDAVQQFTGRLDGVNFELSRATLTRASWPVLDAAVEVLKQYPTIRIEVSGHTDNTGSRETNMKLSQARADAVEQYLVEHGIDESRIVTRGAGPDEPIDSNRTREGRASNRRIEFRVLE